MRVEKPGEKKQFWPFYPAGDGLYYSGWRDDRPLYRLPQLKATPAGVVYLVEGERCADAFAQAFPDIAVTTWAGGTPQWKKTDFFDLSLREVVCLSDGDDVGRKAMLEIAKELEALGCTVHLALPPGNDGEDVADWLSRDPRRRSGRTFNGCGIWGHLGPLSNTLRL